MDKENYIFVPSQKGGQILVDKLGNHYTYVKESKIKTTYKCKSKKCNVFSYIKKADKSISY